MHDKKLVKIVNKVKRELDTVTIKADQAGQNPWEDEEWAELREAEKLDLLRHHLVPSSWLGKMNPFI